MAKDYSPFTPGIPVPIEFFVGRHKEISHLSEKVASSTTGRLQVAFLSGERGIGKSSLARFVRHLVERDHQVLGLHTFLGGVTSLTEMVRRVFDRLLKESFDKPWHENVKEFFEWDDEIWYYIGLLYQVILPIFVLILGLIKKKFFEAKSNG